MALERCAFETDRLRVSGWSERRPPDLAVRVASVLTEATTRFLPPDWHGDYSEERAQRWIAERDAESPTLLVEDQSSGETVGLIILFEEPQPTGPGIDVRLGYVIAEAAWGRGFASELVAGLVGWCRGEPSIRSISGGVEVGNAASVRVLEKNGFALVEDADGPPDEELYRLELR